MELEKEKRVNAKKVQGGNIWRTANINNTKLRGYGDQIVNQHRQAQPNLPPTSMIMGKEN